MTQRIFARYRRAAASSHSPIGSTKVEHVRKAAHCAVEALERRQLMSVSPVASYPFAEGSGTTTADASGNGNTATLNGGITWTSDTPSGSGTALKFDGTSGYVHIGNPSDLNLTGTITLSAWVKPESTSGLQDIIAHGYSTSPYGEDFLRINDGSYQVGSWDGSNHLTSAAIPPSDLNTWVQLTGTYDGSAWDLYRDGQLISSTADSTGAVAVNSDWVIGAGGNTGDRRFFQGTIDDAQIYDQAVSPGTLSQFALPSGWTDSDIGSPGLSGNATYDGTAFNVSGGGSDITGTSDQFNFASQDFTGDGSIVAQVTSQTNTDSWAKAGVMFRNDGSAGSAFAAIFVTPGQGVSFQWRSTADADGSDSFSEVSGISVPTWLKLTRVGDNFTAYYSSDGSSWTQVGSPQAAAVGTNALAGLAVTSHNNSAISDASFTNVELTAASGLPSGWSDGDIGSPAFSGSADYDGTTYTVAGGGTDITGTSDEFNFASKDFSGDGNIIAQVTSQTNTNSWAKAGVMFRNDSSAGSAFAAIFATPGQGVSFQWRSSADADGSGSFSELSGISVPTWFKLSREGDNFTAYYSADGVSWIQVGSTQTAAVGTDALAGLAVTSHNNSAVSQATFTNVSLNSTLVLTSDYTITNDSGTPLAIDEDIETAGYVLTLNGSGSIVVSGTIDGTGSLVKTGSGTLTLTSPNTYSGTTTVADGALLLANTDGSATSSGNVEIDSGATFEGTGTAGGSVTVDSGGTLAPGVGSSTGALNTGELTLASGSYLDIIINSAAPGAGFSQVEVMGDADIDGSNLVLSGSQTSSASADLNFLVVTNSVTGTFAGDTTLNDVTYNALYLPGAGAGVALTTGSPTNYTVELGTGMTGSTVFSDTDTLVAGTEVVSAYSPEQAIDEAVTGSVVIDQSIIGNGVLGPFIFPAGNLVIRNDISPDRRRIMPSELGLNADSDGSYSGYIGLNDDFNLPSNDNDFNDRIWTVEVTPVT